MNIQISVVLWLKYIYEQSQNEKEQFPVLLYRARHSRKFPSPGISQIVKLTQRLDLTEPGKVCQELHKKRKTHFYIWTKTICATQVYLCGLRKYGKISFLAASVTSIYAQHAPCPNAILKKSWTSSAFGQPCAGLTFSRFVLLGTEEAGLWWRKGSWWVAIRPLIRNSACVKEYAYNFYFPPFKVLVPIALYGFCFKIQLLSFIINSLLNVRNYLLLLVFMLLSTFCPVTDLAEHLNMHLRVLLNRHKTRSVLLHYLLKYLLVSWLLPEWNLFIWMFCVAYGSV